MNAPKITAKNNNNRAAIKYEPLVKAAMIIMSSLMNMENGGKPVRANIPRSTAIPVKGNALMTPLMAFILCFL